MMNPLFTLPAVLSLALLAACSSPEKTGRYPIDPPTPPGPARPAGPRGGPPTPPEQRPGGAPAARSA